MDISGKDIRGILEIAVKENASDIFIVAGLPVTWRANGKIHHIDGEKLMPARTESYVQEIYALAGERSMERLQKYGDDDFSFAVGGLSRFRVNAYKQRGSVSAVVRVITFDLPDPEDIDIPSRIIEFGKLSKGLVLVTGPAGSGKSTTLACIVNEINNTQEKHIITLEDPIEYLHRHNRSIVSQREINLDTESYVTALRASLRDRKSVVEGKSVN